MSKTFIMIPRFNVSSCQFFLVSQGWIANDADYLIDDSGLCAEKCTSAALFLTLHRGD